MAHPSMAYPGGEGHSSHRPPLFDGTNYSYWKNRMMIYIKAIEMPLWRMVTDGFTSIVNPVGDVVPIQDKNESLNAKAMNILYCGLNQTEYNRVSGRDSAKKIWELLEVTHEGTTQVKKTRISMLMKSYQLFEMMPNESINDMFTRFGDIVNPLKALGKEYPTEEMIQKILSSLPSS